MATKQRAFLACALALSCLAPGCFGGGKADSAARARAPRSAPSAFDAYSPVDGAPRPHPAPAETLQASARNPVRPDEFGPPADSAFAAPRGQDRLAGYDRPETGDRIIHQDDRMTHARLNMTGSPGEEEVLFSAAIPPVPAAAPGMSPKPFAGAPVGRSNFNRPVRKKADPEPRAKEKMPWESGSLFAGNGASEKERPAVPNIYESRRRQMDEETMWPAGTAMVPPAGARNDALPPLKTETRLPAPAAARAVPSSPDASLPAVKAVSAPAPAAPAASAPAAAPDGDGDEIFSPSMYLGGGR